VIAGVVLERDQGLRAQTINVIEHDADRIDASASRQIDDRFLRRRAVASTTGSSSRRRLSWLRNT